MRTSSVCVAAVCHTVDVGHWRTRDGEEVDLVLERSDGGVIGIEMKTGSRVTQRDSRPAGRPRSIEGVKLNDVG